MADKTRGLGKLMAKSRSMRRSRRGSVDVDVDVDVHDGAGSVGSDDGHAISRDSSSGLSRLSHHFRLSHAPSAASNASDDNRSVVIHVPAGPKDDDEERTSLVSYDSDDLDVSATRPASISNHPSQIGYLTTHSPLIQADFYQGSRPSEEIFTTEQLEDLDPSGSPRPNNLAPPTSRSNKRSPSPVGRIKGLLRSKTSFTKSQASSNASSSPERRPATADAGPSIGATNPYLEFPPAHDSTAVDPEPDSKNAIVETHEQKKGSTERVCRQSRPKSVGTGTPPATPPATTDKGTPVIVNTPPTPTGSTSSKFESPRRVLGSAENSMLSQRRGRSGSASIVPSKLSNISTAPLTPIESVAPTPTPTNQPSGFFTSVLSAAQNAAQNLSNTISSTNIPGGSKNKSVSPVQQSSQEEHSTDDDKVEVEPSVEARPGTLMESKEPAVKTLGMGDLSLSQLGIGEPISRSTTPTTSKFPDASDTNRNRSDSAPVDTSPVRHTVEVPWDDSQRPHSLYEPQAFGEKTPPTGSVFEEGSGIHRSGSVRSAIGRSRNNRKRGSTNGTGGTGNTIAAAISSANASLAQPSAHASAPKLTGFAVASKKRNRDFHALFKSVPDDDYLIEDYSCALQREILAHGRLYVSEGHLCFSSNILGWVTTLVMSFDEIVSVEKRSTALVFKNGLMISTLHAKHIFASFASRDSTYDLIVKIWKLGHPGLQSSLNGVRLDETGGDKTEKIDSESILDGSQSASASEDEASDEGEEVYDEDEEEEDDAELPQTIEAPLLESAIEKTVARKPSGAVANGAVPSEKPKDTPAAPSGVQDFPGPAAHASTDCGDADTHFKKILGDEVIAAPLGKIYDLLFGPASVTWLAKFLTVDQKCTDLQMEDKKGLTQDNRARSYTYIKPLYASIGPKQTKCIITETLEGIDLEKAVNVLVTTQTPDVPSGNVFSVKTKYCLSWAENNNTRLQINVVIEWTGKSWLKGPIENGANEGQTQFCKDLFAALRTAVGKRPQGAANGAAGKGRKRGKKGKSAQAANVQSDTEEAVKTSSKQDWGMLEPLHGILGPVVDIIKPLATGNIVYGLLVGLLVTAWFGFGSNSRPVAAPFAPGIAGFYGYPDRLAAYEEMWRREESELWEWLEERVGIDRLHNGDLHSPRKKVVESRTMDERLRENRMDEREIKEAIRITEEKLKVLKSVVDNKAI